MERDKKAYRVITVFAILSKAIPSVAAVATVLSYSILTIAAIAPVLAILGGASATVLAWRERRGGGVRSREREEGWMRGECWMRGEGWRRGEGRVG